MKKIEYKGGVNPQIFLDRIKDSVSKIEGDTIYFKAFDFNQLKWFVKAMFKRNDDLVYELFEIAIENSISRAIKFDKLDTKSFLDLVNAEAKTLVKNRNTKYYLLGCLSVDRVPFRKIRIGQAILTFHNKRFPQNFIYHRNKFFEEHKLKADFDKNVKFSLEVEATHFTIASQVAYQALENFRGLVNLLINASFEFNFPENPRKVINKFRLGRFLTLHHGNGELAKENYVLEELDYQENYLYLVKENEYKYLKRVLRNRIDLFNGVSKGYEQLLTRALNHYVKAYDSPNMEIAFVNAWTVLETLTKSSKNELTINRILGLCIESDIPFIKEKLFYLKELRNGYVHDAESNFDFRSACFFIQDFIHLIVFYFHLVLAKEFKTPDDAVKYLDLIQKNNLSLLRNKRLKKDFLKKI
jgi:hypothetical protein